MDEFARLRQLLLAEERAEREDLGVRLESRFDALPDALPELLRRSHGQGKLAAALEQPLSEGLVRIARAHPALFVSVLFPLIGPIIRRSIAESLASLIRDLNRGLDHSFTPRGLRWRFEAMRSGVPFSQVVLKHTMRYRVDHLLLVQNGSGLLLSHVANGESGLADSDAVAAMLSAIQDFAHDAALAREGDALDAVALGDLNLRILRGPLMHLAVAVRGELSDAARRSLSELIESMHLGHESAASLEGAQEQFKQSMEDWLGQFGQETGELKQSGFPWLATCVFATSLFCVGLWFAFGWWHARQALALERALSQTAGYHATVQYRSGNYWITGLRDPHALDPLKVAQAAGIPGARIRTELAPYLALAPQLMVERTRTALGLPKQVQIFAEPAGVKIVGTVEHADWQLFQARLPALQALVSVDASELLAKPVVIDAKVRFEQVAAKLKELRISFEQSVNLNTQAPETIREAQKTIKELGEIASADGASVKLSIVGYTDGSGRERGNLRLRKARAEVVREALTFPTSFIEIRTLEGRPESQDYSVDLARRFVTLEATWQR